MVLKKITPSIVLTTLSSYTIVNGLISNNTLELSHYLGILSSILALVTFFISKNHYPKIILVVLTLGVFNIIEVTPQSISFFFNIGIKLIDNTFHLGINPMFLVIGILTLIISRNKED